MADESASADQSLNAAVANFCSTANVDLLVVAGDMSHGLDTDLCALIESKRSRENVVLMLGTFGGSPDIAYKVSRILQTEYTKFIAVVDTYCKSAGTLLVIGAHELVLSNRGELGPLDIQVGKSDEPKERTSGLAPVQALKILQEQVAETYLNLFSEFARGLPIPTRTAVATAEAITSALYSKLYSQLEPIRLGEFQRSMALMTEYGQRLQVAGGNVRPGTIKRLVTEYPDHGFVIDRAEAAELFHTVRGPSETERRLLKFLEPVFAEYIGSPRPLVHYATGQELQNDEPSREKARPAAGHDPLRDVGTSRPTGEAVPRPEEARAGSEAQNDAEHTAQNKP